MVEQSDRNRFLALIVPYRRKIEEMEKREAAGLKKLEQNPGGGREQIGLVELMLDMSSQYILIDRISQTLLKMRNDKAQDEARKALFKALSYLEKLVTGLVDAPFAEYEQDLEAIAFMSATERLCLVQKMGLTIELLEAAFGENSRWKWSFVNVEGRFAAVAKNIIDLKVAAAQIRDFQSPDHKPVMLHLMLVKRLLTGAANRYREKYERVSSQVGDFNQSILFLNALRYILTIMGNSGEVEGVIKTITVWSTKLEADLKEREQKKV
ncbi:MAG: hypothetical protein LBT11_07465 [Treponema sp.]|jgi:hypothetical protein|nr:hypothetical protein [Treponema sp.]